MKIPIWPCESFFNTRVQSVLKSRLNLPVERGWTIEAFIAIDAMSNDGVGRLHSYYDAHLNFIHFYAKDPEFCANLLAILTWFHGSERNLTTSEIITRYVEKMRSNCDEEELVRSGGIPAPKLVSTWDEIADFINEAHINKQKGKHHQIKGDTLRTRLFDREIERRNEKLKLWRHHITAWKRAMRHKYGCKFVTPWL